MKEDVERLFDLLANLDAGARERYWRQHPVPAEVRSDVESLLAFDRGSSAALREEFGSVVSSVVSPAEDWRALRCGAYRLTDVIGRGGMGVVYRAERADGQLTHSAAIKLLPAGLDDPSARILFLRERQILAGLAHQGIARLLDAGQLADGRPYLVMERVDGVSIDQYARDLPLDQKLRLFLSVCRAVSYAHANLVVHRDIKPSNILVTWNGETKLLDFGIARMLDASSSGITREARLTPDYASPEQVRGEAPTTATDVYSLGAVLYVMLTGRKPHQIDSLTPGAIEAAICHAQIGRPSQFVPGLRGDLETILLKALRKERGERYASVEKMAEDIDAFLNLRPIQARAGELGYAARKFIRRYWLPVGALALAVAGLAAGLLAARRERAVAQERFDQVRQLAGRLFEVDKDIQQLPGSVAARERIVRTALEYLEKLSRTAKGDPALALDVARGYTQVAQMQGVQVTVNLGRMDQAEESLARAERILRPQLDRGTSDPEVLHVAATIAHYRMLVAQQEHREQAALSRAAEAVARTDAAAATGRADASEMALVFQNVALTYQNFYRAADAVHYARRGVEAARGGKNAAGLLQCLGRLANTLRINGDLEEALMTIHEAQKELRASSKTRAASDWRAEFTLNLYEGNILGGESTVSLNRPPEAAVRLQAALDLAEGFARRDPKDSGSRLRLCDAARGLAEVLRPSDPARALAALDMCALRASEVPGNSRARREQAVVLGRSAASLRQLGRAAEARRRLERAMSILEGTGDDPRGKFAPMDAAEDVLIELADHHAATGERRQAIALYERILTNLDRTAGFRPDTDLRHANSLSRLLDALARQNRAVGRSGEAGEFDVRRLRLWESHDRLRPGNLFIQRRLSAAQLGTASAKKNKSR